MSSGFLMDEGDVRHELARRGQAGSIPLLDAALNYYQDQKRTERVMARRLRRLMLDAQQSGVSYRLLAIAFGRPNSWVIEQLRVAREEAS